MDNGYTGKIKNSGNQVVTAPIKSAHGKMGTVVRGKDLRSGK